MLQLIATVVFWKWFFTWRFGSKEVRMAKIQARNEKVWKLANLIGFVFGRGFRIVFEG